MTNPSKRPMRIGVLSLQGAFIEHMDRLHSLKADAVELRCAADLSAPLDGLVLPGGREHSPDEALT